MKITKSGTLYRAFRTTGPTSNMLGIDFGRRSDVEVVALEGPGGAPQVDGSDVRVEVIGALTEFNAERGASLSITKIEFVPSDSPGEGVYASLARALFEAAVNAPP